MVLKQDPWHSMCSVVIVGFFFPVTSSCLGASMKCKLGQGWGFVRSVEG